VSIQKRFIFVVLIGLVFIPFNETRIVLAPKPEGILSGPDILLLVADMDTSYDSPIQIALEAYDDLSSVDIVDAHGYTPSLSFILNYEVVITWAANSHMDTVAIGDVLADYIDFGGKVINLNYSTGTTGYQIQGRFLTGAYSAMNTTSNYNDSSCLGSYFSSHSIMAGITNVCDTYRMTGTYLLSGSSEIAQWDDGLIFVAAKNNRSVVTINSYVGYYYVWTGQMVDLLHNAILWLSKDNLSYLPLIQK